jgi:UDP-glucose 4-epimerase
MANCLVFGGHGFIGTHLVARLLSDGHDVKTFDISTKKQQLPPVEPEVDNNPEIITGDFLEYDAVNTAMKNIDYVFHYITLTYPKTSINDPSKETKNLMGTVNILEAAKENEIKKIIYPSSGGTIYGSPEELPVPETHPLRPTTPYAITKTTVESLLGFYHEQYDLGYTVLRISNPFGPGQNSNSGFGVIAVFFDKIKNSHAPVIYGDGSNIRDYIFISDVIEANVLAISSAPDDKVFNVGSGVGFSLIQLIELMSEVTGIEVSPRFEPAGKHYISQVYLDITRIREKLGWEPKIGLKTGLEKMWSWVKDNES